MSELEPEEQARYEALLARHLSFYDSLRTRERRPKTSAQRQFQDVAWGVAQPVTEHEKGYVFYLRRAGLEPFAVKSKPPHIDDVMSGHPVGARPVSSEIGRKWDERWIDH